MDESENVIVQKQRHGCITAWLAFMIVINSLVAIMYLFAKGLIASNLATYSTTMIMLLGVVSVANVVFAVMLWQWKKIGFWGFVVSSIVALILNLIIGLGIGQSLFGLVGIAVLYGVLQIKKDNVSAWDYLE